MKKLAILFLIPLFAVGVAYGQVGFQVGANLGGCYNVLSPDVEGMDNWTGIGFGGGLVANVSVLDMLDIELDIIYLMTKYEFEMEIFDETYKATVSINKLVIPVLVKYKFPVAENIAICVGLGPSFIKWLSGKVKAEFAGETEEQDIESEDLETDFGLQVGLSMPIMVTPNISIVPDFRFHYILTADDDETEDAKESAYDILFGVNFVYTIK